MSESIRLSNSKSNTYRRCPKQFDYKYVRKLSKKTTGLPLKRGDWLHQLLMVHYDGYDWHERQAELTAEFNKLFDEEKEEYGDLPSETKRIMRTYLKHYEEEDKYYRVVDSELDELIDLPNGDTFNFIIDLVIEERDGGLWLWDHKTVKGFMPEDFMLIDSQLARYFWSAEKLGYKPLRGVMFNEIITKPPTLPKLTAKTGQLERRKNIWCDAYSYMAEIKRQGLDPKDYRDFLMYLKAKHDKWFKRTRLPRDKAMTKQLMKELMWTGDEMRTAMELNRFPRTARKECRFDCDFLDACQIELQGGDIDDLVKDRYEIKKRDAEEHPGWAPKPGK